ncbi:hypothetical protein Tco_0406960 [Tanacetum coccineum]
MEVVRFTKGDKEVFIYLVGKCGDGGTCKVLGWLLGDMYLRFEGLEYIDADIMDFKEILSRIYGREVHRVYVFDFGGLTDLMDEGLSNRMLMEHMFQLGGVRRHMSWREFILGISSAGDFLGTTSSYTSIRDLMLRLCHKMIAYNIARRSQAPETEICFREEAGGHNSWRSVYFKELDDTWACVALGLERQQVVAAGAPEAAKDALVVDEGA